MRSNKEIVRSILPTAYCRRHGRHFVVLVDLLKTPKRDEALVVVARRTARSAWWEARLLVQTPVRNIKNKNLRRLVRKGHRALSASLSAGLPAEVSNHVLTCAECRRQYTVHAKGPLDCFFVGLCFTCIKQHSLSFDEIAKVLRSLCYQQRQSKG